MSEIIWAMNSGFDTLEDLIAYSRRYAYEYVEDYPLRLTFTSHGDTAGIPLRGERRRNILLILKEALHNTVKHAQATEVTVTFAVEKQQIQLTVQDNGVGLPDTTASLGNGLKNIIKRAEQMQGAAKFVTDSGTILTAVIPITRHEP